MPDTTPEAHYLARLWDGGNTTTLYEQIALEEHLPPAILSALLLDQILIQVVHHGPSPEAVAELRAKFATWIGEVRRAGASQSPDAHP